MTPQEHELVMLLLGRIYERLEVIRDALKSREIWTTDDEKAFESAVHSDPQKILRSARLAMRDYLNAIRENFPEDPEREALLQALQGEPHGLKES